MSDDGIAADRLPRRADDQRATGGEGARAARLSAQPGRWPGPFGATTSLAVVICGSAAALRIWRLSWGLPAHSGFPDEWASFTVYAPSFVPLTWASFTAHGFQYPTLYGYLIGLTTALLHGLGVLTGPVPATSMDALMVGRGLSAAMGLATIGLVALLGKRMYSPGVALSAAALMAVAPFHVMYGHIAATDVPLTALTALTMLAAHATTQGETPLSPAAGGFVAGLAFATKYTGLAMLAPVVWALLERTLRERSASRSATSALAALLGFALGTSLGCPPCVMHPGEVLGGMRHLHTVTSVHYLGFSNNCLTPTLGWYGRPYVYQLVASLPFSFGWPLYALALVGVCVAMLRRELADRLILATLVPYLVVIGGSMVVFPRYLLPLFPGLILLASRAAWVVFPWPYVRVVLLAAVWLYSLGLSATQVARFSFDQQRAVARWILEAPQFAGRLPKTIRVAVADEMVLDYFRLTKPLATAGLDFVRVARGHWFDRAADVFILPEWFEIAIERDRPSALLTRDLERLRSGAAGYRPAAHWSSSYLQRDFYTRIDPGFAADLWQGEIGFTLYVRESTAR
jgi:hypothetical protein